MRRRLSNQIGGDPASAALAVREAQLLADVARFPRVQPEIMTRAQRERVTAQVREEDRNGGAGPIFQGSGSGMSSRPEALPPSPAAPIKRGPGRPRKYPVGSE